MRTTRTPASASRASVPPHISDSSSGWANTARTERARASDGVALPSACLMPLDDAPVDVDALADHPRRAESGDRALADAPAIEIEDARQLVRHLLEIVVHDPRDAVVDHLADGAAIERRHRRAAGHRLGEH